MVFGGIVPLQYRPHQWEMVDRMSSDANQISDSAVSGDIRFGTENESGKKNIGVNSGDSNCI